LEMFSWYVGDICFITFTTFTVLLTTTNMNTQWHLYDFCLTNAHAWLLRITRYASTMTPTTRLEMFSWYVIFVLLLSLLSLSSWPHFHDTNMNNDIYMTSAWCMTIKDYSIWQ
jgi:hypothetical protein